MSPSPTGTRGVEPGPRASGRSPASPRAKTPPLLVADQLLDALHDRLVAGEAHLKGYRLPWEDAFLEHRRWDAAGRLYVADPNLELLALLARFVTKLGPLHVARHLLGRPLVAHGWLHEYPWLRE